MSTPPLPILPLPESVISRLRSNITIPTLAVAISELIQNSLDASSTQLTLTLNPSRPSFTLSDNGHGILPDQLQHVGTIHSTSKYSPRDEGAGRYFGSRGEALAALAQHAVVTVTSRAKGWRGTRMLRWSFGEKIFVGVPEEYASLPEAGTTVRVEGLWGDMPVRIKARAGADMEREWGEVIRAALGLLLSGRGRGVGLVVRDENGARKLGIKAEFRGAWDLAVLRQGVGEDVVGSERDWECVKARQNGVRIEGWICSRGIGSRNVQFLAVNGFPLMNETELHREINRVFSASSFGTIEETENGRRAPTRKGVERKGMFVLRIECRGGAALGGEGGTDGKAGVEGENLKHVIQLLQKLAYEFLKAHHYRPLAIGSTAPKPDPPVLTIPELFEQQKSTSALPGSPSTPSALELRDRGRMMDLDSWSRVKAARFDRKEMEGRFITGGTAKIIPASKYDTSALLDSPTTQQPDDSSGEVVNWINPSSGKTYQLNTRTGNTSLAGRKRSIRSVTPDRHPRISIPNKRSKSAEASRVPGPFVQNLLKTWKNPVFTPPTCAPIPSIPLDFTPCDHTHIFTASTAQRIGKLTKAGLQDAQVIAQVDKKYILLRMHGLASPSRTEPELLVILDQHAADERVRVERLFRELCTNATEDIKTPLSFVVSARDRGLLKRYEKEWERWGVRYTVLDEQRTVTVVALPAVARDRCESPADRGIVVEMLRRGVYEFEERGTTTMAETDEDDTGGGWVHLLSRIPTALVEMINSRACRGAVMFNDPLTIKECRELVKRLGRCRWPFMCAHGRVSMRPLVELGSEADSRGGGLERKVGFREAFGNWEKRKANTQVVVELD